MSYCSRLGGFLLLILCIACVGLTSQAQAQCVSGTVTADFQESGPHAGLWKYTMTVTWDLPHGLSNITLDCGFGVCPGTACSKVFEFDAVAGTSTGEPEPCTVEYAGEFNCEGNPSVGIDVPIVKWDVISEDCQPGPTGSGTFCFYVNAGPHEDSPLPVTIIKDDLDVCSETITGDCPAVCIVPVEETTWGAVKYDHGR